MRTLSACAGMGASAPAALAAGGRAAVGTVAVAAVPVGPLTAAATATHSTVGREELIHGELDMAEDLAGVILAAAAGALLLGHAVVVGGHEQLGVSL